jgi:hypothetical protein
MKKIIFTLVVFAFVANVSAQLKVDATGQVGIGTANPQYKLDITGNTRVVGNIYLESDSNLIATTNNVPITFKVNGVLAGSTGSSGKYNVSFGYRSLSALTSGNYNTATGYYALTSNTSGYYNTATGANALYSNISGYSNTATGRDALYSNTSGGYNTATGYYALRTNTTGSYNTASGHYALYGNTTGYYNTASGSYALRNNTTGYYNTANGYYALYNNSTGSNNTAGGYYALRYNTGSYNTAYGANTLHSNSTGSTGNYNTAIGYNALYANSTGSSNTANGYNALYTNTTGSFNTAIGRFALYNNTMGSYNTAIGYAADVDGDNWSNSTAIGYSAVATGNNQVRVGNNSVSSIGGQVGWTTGSDKRIKKNIRTDVPGLDFINRLQPVTYNLDLDALDALLNNTKKSSRDESEQPLSQELADIEKKAREAQEKRIQTGFIAQDVEETAKSIGYDFSGVDVDETGFYGLRYAEFVVPLVKAVQELSEQNERLQALVESLQVKDADSALLRSGNTAESTTGLQDVANSGAYLQQNAPNPFTQSTQIKYYLPATVKTAYLCIYDLQGAQLKQTVIQERGEGAQTLYGSELKAGIYLYALIADGQEVDTKRMILTK